MAHFTAPIVGMHFRPPAKDIINCLASGVELLLEHQPENPHDGDAVRVLLYGFTIGGQHESLFKTFNDDPANEGRLTDPFMLGFIANSEKTGGKFASTLVKCFELMECPSVPAKLSFTIAGAPAAEIEVPDEVAAKLGDEAARVGMEMAIKKLEDHAKTLEVAEKLKNTDDEIPF